LHHDVDAIVRWATHPSFFIEPIDRDLYIALMTMYKSIFPGPKLKQRHGRNHRLCEI